MAAPDDLYRRRMAAEGNMLKYNMSGSAATDPRALQSDIPFNGTASASTTTSTDQNPSITEAQGSLKQYMGELSGNQDFAARTAMQRARDMAEGIKQQTMGNIARSGAGLQSGAAMLQLGKVQDQATRNMQEANTTMGIHGREQYGNLLAQQAGLANAAAGNQVSMTGMQNELLRTQQAQQQAQAQLAMQQQQMEMEKERLKQQIELEKMRLAQQAAIAGIGATTGTQPTVASAGGGIGVNSAYQGNINAGGQYSRWV